MLKDPSDLKCKVAEIIYDEFMVKWYGIEPCKFEGYSTLYDLIFQIDLLEANKNCNTKTTC